MTKPNLFIVGAAKSGTSTIWYNLKNHPSIFLPQDEFHKEPKYFSPLAKPKNQTFEDYLKIFEQANQEDYIGEASSAYLTDPMACNHIFNFNPQAKIIIILRNPAERAFSLYNWMVQEGYEYERSFEKALNKEPKRINKKIPNFWEPEYYYNYLYFHSGLYYEQVKRYLDTFGANVQILSFEELKSKQDNVVKALFDFLELRPIPFQNPYINPSKRVLSPKLQFTIRKIIKYKEAFNLRVLKNSNRIKAKRDRLLDWGTLEQPPAPIKEGTRKNLLKHYKNDVYLLSELTGYDFTYWLEEQSL